MAPPPSLPNDVRDWLVQVFSECNDRASAKITRIPNTYETSLDLTLIEHLSNYKSPVKFPSNWIVRLETHYLGGARHFYRWEIADIGVLVVFRHQGKISRTKVALLQSKRLYSIEEEWNEPTAVDMYVGFARLHESDVEFNKLTNPRTLSFSADAQYKSLPVGDEQYKAVSDYERTTKIPVFYLLYNPMSLPWSVDTPVTGDLKVPTTNQVGARVLPASVLRATLTGKAHGYKPTYKDLSSASSPFDNDPSKAGWRLEDFMVQRVIGCHDGHIADSLPDPGLQRVFGGRTAPISAAIAVTIDSAGNAP